MELVGRSGVAPRRRISESGTEKVEAVNVNTEKSKTEIVYTGILAHGTSAKSVWGTEGERMERRHVRGSGGGREELGGKDKGRCHLAQASTRCPHQTAEKKQVTY